MIYSSVLDCIGETPVVALHRLFPGDDVEVLAKLEFLNPGGSAKDRPARHIVETGLRAGAISQKSHIVESSSGNLGIALAMVCRIHQLPLTVVVDPNITASNLMLLRRLGANVEMVSELDEHGDGYLNRRLSRVHELVETVPGAVWINQYANELAWQAHRATGREIISQIGTTGAPIDYFVAAVSTAGTIHGVSRVLREQWPQMRAVAVDAAGSVIFGGSPGRRRLPGIGAGRVPELLCRDEIDQVIKVDDVGAARGCRALLAEEAMFAGGSSGSVVSAIGHLRAGLPVSDRPARILCLLADRGERYFDLVYGDSVNRLDEVGDDLCPVSWTTSAGRIP